jgi:hypothetical protein
MPLVSRTQLENAMGAGVVRQIFDDTNDGVVNDAAIAQLVAEVEGFIYSALQPLYPNSIPFPDNAIPPVVLTMALDLAQAYARDRHPEYVRADGEALRKRVDATLEKIRSGAISLDSSALPNANNAQVLYSSGMAAERALSPRYFDNMGDFGINPRRFGDDRNGSGEP